MTTYPGADLVLTWGPSVVHGRYTVVRKLAEGGMAEIFLARQHGSEGFEKPVVLKRIHSAFYADEQFRNMLVDEAHISMSLHHNNIVQVLDLGRAGGRLFLVLELVDGWDLARVLERTVSGERAAAARAGSLHHRRGLPGAGLRAQPHRLRRASRWASSTATSARRTCCISEQGEVKLADFGIAKALTKRDRTATGVVKGKIAFMSPEQAHGQAHRRPLRPVLARHAALPGDHRRAAVRGGDRLRGHRAGAEVSLRPPEQVSPGMPDRWARSSGGP